MYSYGKWISQNKNTALLVVLPFFRYGLNGKKYELLQ